MKRLTLIFLLVFIVGCAAPLDPLAVIKDSTAKQATVDYAIEYHTESTVTINNQPLEHDFRTTITKSDARKKTSVYASEIVLLSELYAQDNEQTLCIYGKTLADVTCAKLESSSLTFDTNMLLARLAETGVFTFVAQEQKLKVSGKERACDNVQYAFIPSKLTPENAQRIAPLLGINAANADTTTVIRSIAGSICFDKTTGLPLETTSSTSAEFGNVSYMQERRDTATSLTLRPLVSEQMFTLPAEAVS